MSKTAQNKPLSKHCTAILELLSHSEKPLSAYDILEKTRDHGIKAPPTVYRALETLTQRGLAHKVESLNAFVACEHQHEHNCHDTHFAICDACGNTVEIDCHDIDKALESIKKDLAFQLNHSLLELHGTCQQCTEKPALQASA